MLSCDGCINRKLHTVCVKCIGWNMYTPATPCGTPKSVTDISREMKLVSKGILTVFLADIKNNGKVIKKVIFNAPATIVIWTDGTKTVVKSGNYDVYDPEKGLAMAIAKKALGNNGNYYKIFKKWLPEELEEIDSRTNIVSEKVDNTDGSSKLLDGD